jgi:hypothetical protein
VGLEDQGKLPAQCVTYSRVSPFLLALHPVCILLFSISVGGSVDSRATVGLEGQGTLPAQCVTYCHATSSLLALKSCVHLGLLHGLLTLNFSGVWSLAPHPTHNLEEQELHFNRPLCFELSAMAGPTRSLRSRQHSCLGHINLHSTIMR